MNAAEHIVEAHFRHCRHGQQRQCRQYADRNQVRPRDLYGFGHFNASGFYTGVLMSAHFSYRTRLHAPMLARPYCSRARENLFAALNDTGAILRCRTERAQDVEMKVIAISVLNPMWPESLGGQSAGGIPHHQLRDPISD
jgi:hypothetical protein